MYPTCVFLNFKKSFKGSDLFILNNVCKYFRLVRTFTRISSKLRNGHILVCTFERTLKNKSPTTRVVNRIWKRPTRFELLENEGRKREKGLLLAFYKGEKELEFPNCIRLHICTTGSDSLLCKLQNCSPLLTITAASRLGIDSIIFLHNALSLSSSLHIFLMLSFRKLRFVISFSSNLDEVEGLFLNVYDIRLLLL